MISIVAIERIDAIGALVTTKQMYLNYVLNIQVMFFVRRRTIQVEEQTLKFTL